MPAEALKQAAGLAYREAMPNEDSGLAPAVCLHGFPESSYMWRYVLDAIAATGRRAIAPDFPGYGDSPPDLPATWERQMEALERFRRELGIERAALVLHDWGGLIGLRWACEHPDAAVALVLSNTGFFADGTWHGMARAMRTPGEGEKLVESMTREAFGQMLAAVSRGFDKAAAHQYWQPFASARGQQGILDLYRSGDFEKLAAYDGRLAALGLPTLILWGENDLFAPVTGAYRFHKEIPNSKLVVLEDAGHFVYADKPLRAAQEVAAFLAALDV